MKITDDVVIDGLIEFMTKKRRFHILTEMDIIAFLWDRYQVPSTESERFLTGFLRRMEEQGKCQVFTPWRITIQRWLGMIP